MKKCVIYNFRVELYSTLFVEKSGWKKQPHGVLRLKSEFKIQINVLSQQIKDNQSVLSKVSKSNKILNFTNQSKETISLEKIIQQTNSHLLKIQQIQQNI